MRENRKYDAMNPNGGLLMRLTPRKNVGDRTPIADMDENRTAHFRLDQNVDQEYLCWCMLSTSKGTGTNYHALPIGELDAINSMVLLNRSIAIKDNDPLFEISADAMSEVLEGFKVLRPDKILCAEGKIASNRTTDQLLKQEKLVQGQPEIRVGEICYLGSYLGDHANYVAAGVNGQVILENFNSKRREEIKRDYVGPIYVAREISKSGAQFKTYRGFALPWIEGKLRGELFSRYWYQDRNKRTALDKLVCKQLEVPD